MTKKNDKKEEQDVELEEVASHSMQEAEDKVVVDVVVAEAAVEEMKEMNEQLKKKTLVHTTTTQSLTTQMTRHTKLPFQELKE